MRLDVQCMVVGHGGGMLAEEEAGRRERSKSALGARRGCILIGLRAAFTGRGYHVAAVGRASCGVGQDGGRVGGGE